MNASGVNRGYMSKGYNWERFLLHVVKMMEAQLKEWDSSYEINLLKLKDYELWIKQNDEYRYEAAISKSEAAALQRKSPFSLDIALWRQLQDQGLELKRGYGNYIEIILGKYKGGR